MSEAKRAIITYKYMAALPIGTTIQMTHSGYAVMAAWHTAATCSPDLIEALRIELGEVWSEDALAHVDK